MNNSSAETKRMADAVAGVAATIAEIMDARVKKLGEAMEQQVAIRTAVPPPPIEPWVDKKAVAEHFNVSVRTIENWMRDRHLPYMKMGRKNVRFKLSEADEAINRRAKLHSRWSD